jgi:hypothetical protein
VDSAGVIQRRCDERHGGRLAREKRLISSDQGKLIALDRSEPVPPYGNFQRRFWAREVGLADNQAKTVFGMIHWGELLQNMRQERFDEALRIVSDGDAIREGVPVFR